MFDRPTEKDIQRVYPSGAYTLPCDGRHPQLNHFYYFYTKKEVMKQWRAQHPRKTTLSGSTH